MFVLGLTGSIGMGKTTVGSFFHEFGATVLNADEMVHKLYCPGGAAVLPIEEAFPGVIVNNGVDRKLLSLRVVGNEEAMRRLESIVHPLVTAERRWQLRAAAQAGARLVVLDVPLLYETGMEDQVDAVAVVSAPEEVQRQRVLGREGMTPGKLDAILGRQLPDAEKRKRADFIINTAGSLEETREHVAALVKSLIGRQGRVFMRTCGEM